MARYYFQLELISTTAAIVGQQLSNIPGCQVNVLTSAGPSLPAIIIAVDTELSEADAEAAIIQAVPGVKVHRVTWSPPHSIASRVAARREKSLEASSKDDLPKPG